MEKSNSEVYRLALCRQVAQCDPENRKKEIDKLQRILKALDLIYDALYKFTDRDDYPIMDILLDDNGNCIHITLSDWVSIDVIKTIGKVFGDNNPSLTISDINTAPKYIKVIVINSKRRELIAQT